MSLGSGAVMMHFSDLAKANVMMGIISALIMVGEGYDYVDYDECEIWELAVKQMQCLSQVTVSLALLEILFGKTNIENM